MKNINNSLVLENINYKVDNQIILKDINLEVKKGDFISLLGESGSGKSTILKIIAGIINDYKGNVFINDKNVNKVKTKNRKACIVFQDYLLFPHLNVYENIAFGLRAKKEDKDYIKKRVKELIELTKLEDCEYKYENQLSGGQRQRVAIARALAINPDILLLDEPFSSLDDSLKDDMRNFLLDIRKRIDITTILVTHDKKEAFFMSKKIAVLMDRRIIAYEKPFDLYKYPKNKKLADFLEERNYISGYIHDNKFNYRMKVDLDSIYEDRLEAKDDNSFKKLFENINEQRDGYLYKSFDLNYIKSKKSIFSFSEENLFELCDYIKCDLMINKENIKIYSINEFYKYYSEFDRIQKHDYLVNNDSDKDVEDKIQDDNFLENDYEIKEVDYKNLLDRDYKLKKEDYKKIYKNLMKLNSRLYENLKIKTTDNNSNDFMENDSDSKLDRYNNSFDIKNNNIIMSNILLRNEYIKFFIGKIKSIKFRGSKMSYKIKVFGFLDFYINIDIDSNEKFDIEDVIILKVDLKDLLFFDRV